MPKDCFSKRNTAVCEKPVLTVSLLCSGRERTKECLESLAVLRKRVSSELILVDTGCDEETRQVLSSYADEIVPFVWCDDFAEARNAGLKRARGEWFLYLDDDECFIDTAAIEEFFLSGEYRNYGYAVYTVRNFYDVEGNVYQDNPVVRMYSLGQKGRFQGIVHEHFEPLMEPAKILSSVAIHTGYIYTDEEDKKKHASRNIRLLEKAVSEENGDHADKMRLWAHLAQEYFMMEDYEKLSAFCEKVLAESAAWQGESVNRHRGCFYCGRILAKMLQGDEEAAERYYESACSDSRNTGYCTARLMALGTELFWEKKVEKAGECCRRYLELWEHYRERPEALFKEQTFFVVTAFYDEIKNRILSYRICRDLESGDTSSLCRYIDFFGWEKPQVYMTEELMPCIVRAISEFPYDKIFAHVADILVNRPGMDNFWEAMEEIEEEEKLGRAVRVFSEMTQGAGSMAAADLKEMLNAEKKEDWKNFSEHLKKAVGACPHLGKLLKRYAYFYAKHRSEKAEEKDRAGKEKQALAAQIKAQIRILFEQGMRQEAVEALEQLRRVMPEDKELEELMRSEML